MVAVFPAMGALSAYHWPVAGLSGVRENVAGVAVRVCPTVGVPARVGWVSSRNAVTTATVWYRLVATAEAGFPASSRGAMFQLSPHMRTAPSAVTTPAPYGEPALTSMTRPAGDWPSKAGMPPGTKSPHAFRVPSSMRART